MNCPECGSDNVEQLDDQYWLCLDCRQEFRDDWWH